MVTRTIELGTPVAAAKRRQTPVKDPRSDSPPIERPPRKRPTPVDDPKPDEPPIEPPDDAGPPVKEPPRRRR
jgi:hypothetical protein